MTPNAIPLTLPAATERILKGLRLRLTTGLFLDVWPRWTAGLLFVAGCVALLCRVYFAGASTILPWLWLAPAVTLIPALTRCWTRAYQPSELLALADSLAGGQGTILAIAETGDTAWPASRPLLAELALPQLHPWRRLRLLIPAALFLALAIAIPQRLPAAAPNTAIAREIVRDLEATLAAIKKQELVSPVEEKKLEEEIERIRKGAMDRLDPSSWEAADALRERMAASLSEKQDALKWAEESLLRYADAARGGATPTEAQSDELAKALEKLAESGMLGGLPPELEKLLGDKNAAGQFKLPQDAAARAKLAASLSEFLGARGERFGEIAKLGREFGRFDPSEFPLDSDGMDTEIGGGLPGNGGIDRGRGDAALTWGKETDPADRFRAETLPPGMAGSPDDWAPVAMLPGAPKAAPQAGTPAAARDYAAGTGQAAWRRSLAPRHYSAVKNYFEK